MPVVLGAGGVERIVEVDLGEDQGNFDKACEGLREQVEQVRGVVEGTGVGGA